MLVLNLANKVSRKDAVRELLDILDLLLPVATSNTESKELLDEVYDRLCVMKNMIHAHGMDNNG